MNFCYINDEFYISKISHDILSWHDDVTQTSSCYPYSVGVCSDVLFL